VITPVSSPLFPFAPSFRRSGERLFSTRECANLTEYFHPFLPIHALSSLSSYTCTSFLSSHTHTFTSCFSYMYFLLFPPIHALSPRASHTWTSSLSSHTCTSTSFFPYMYFEITLLCSFFVYDVYPFLLLRILLSCSRCVLIVSYILRALTVSYISSACLFPIHVSRMV
jgi:hypothetical protein